jgi:hypothetical protein
MPEASVSQLRTGSFNRSRIIFRTNMITGNTPEIRLGLLSELVIGPCRVFGMSIRKELTPREVSWLPDSWRDDLAQPPGFLDDQFEEAWRSTIPGQAITFLSERHYGSLFVATPDNISMPSLDVTDAELPDAALDAVLGLLVREQARVSCRDGGI